MNRIRRGCSSAPTDFTRTTMFDSCVVKLTAYCNLDCSYCYMFNLNDRTYTRVPRELPSHLAVTLVHRVVEHLRCRDAKHFRFVLHGGEPTLWSAANFEAFLAAVDRGREDGLELDVSLQTNGLTLRQSFLQRMRRHGVTVGISLDGPRAFHDRHRVDHAGRGSYERIMRNVSSALDCGFEDVFGGFLAVANPDIPPDRFLDWVESLPIRRADVLWPIQYHHGNPPWTEGDWEGYRSAPRYGRWFAELFDLWWERDDPDLYIRLFFEAVERLLGSKRHTDAIGNDTLNLFVVNTDGSIEYPDHVRAFADGAASTRYHLQRHSLQQVASDPTFEALLNLASHRSPTCDTCRHLELCGGGFLAGRMRPDEARLDLRSVLCADQYFFFSAVRRRLSRLLSDNSGANPMIAPYSDPTQEWGTHVHPLPVVHSG